MVSGARREGQKECLKGGRAEEVEALPEEGTEWPCRAINRTGQGPDQPRSPLIKGDRDLDTVPQEQIHHCVRDHPRRVGLGW